MSLKNCTPVLFCKDAKKSKDFYVNVLGLKVVGDFGGLNFIFEEGFAIWQIMEGHIILEKLGAENIFDSKNTSKTELCFELEADIVEVFNKLKESNVRFLHEINEELWGQRTVRFYDLDGHLIEIGESFPVFLKRVYEEEGTVEATARRTYMEEDMVKKILGI